MIRALALISLLATPVGADQPLMIVIDGEFVGTLAEPGVKYDYTAGIIEIPTNELVYGCKQDRFFHDRFED